MEKKDNHSKHVNTTRGADKLIQKARAVSFAGAATSTILVETKHVFCRDKSMLVATSIIFSQQNIFVVTKLRVLLRQTRICRDKHVFVATNTCLLRLFVATKVILMAAPANDRSVLTRRRAKATKRRTNQNIALRISSTASSSDFLVSALVADSALFFNPAHSVGLPTSLHNLTAKQPLVHPSS